MRDRGLDIFLVVFFGVVGIAVLILAWTGAMPLSEKVLSTSAGSVGILGAIVRTLVLKSVWARSGVAPAPVEARVKENS